jgi:hypothetical protein
MGEGPGVRCFSAAVGGRKEGACLARPLGHRGRLRVALQRDAAVTVVPEAVGVAGPEGPWGAGQLW